jgi:hypothetical protein
MVIMHDSFRGPQSWEAIGRELNSGGQNLFGIDTHLYQVFSQQDKALNQAGHIKKACNWLTISALQMQMCQFLLANGAPRPKSASTIISRTQLVQVVIGRDASASRQT